MPVEIHPTAVVDQKAEIGDDVEIGPYSIIGPHVKIGDGCRVSSHVRIVGNTQIGKDNRFFHSCAIGEEAQDILHRSEKSLVEIGDDNVFREYTTLHRSGHDEGLTQVGSHCYFMVGSHIAHDCKLSDSVIITNHTPLGGFVEVGESSFISGLSGVHQHCRIGKFCMIGAMVKVVQDVPPFIMAVGNPAKAASLNVVGMKRAGITPESRAVLKNVFKILYLQKNSVKGAVDIIKNQVLPEIKEKAESHRLVSEFLEFITSATRGIIGYSSDSQ